MVTCVMIWHEHTPDDVCWAEWQGRPGILASCEETWLQARYFFQQLLAGLEYCHTKVGVLFSNEGSSQLLLYVCCSFILLSAPAAQGTCAEHSNQMKLLNGES
jgi:hypothetical protein